ncbi:protein of unknown function [Burkholderia multivorans]
MAFHHIVRANPLAFVCRLPIRIGIGMPGARRPLHAALSQLMQRKGSRRHRGRFAFKSLRFQYINLSSLRE